MKIEIREIPKEYDLAVGTLGFEARSRYVLCDPRIRAKAKFALGYRDSQVLSYTDNLRALEENGVRIELADSKDVSACLARLCSVLPPEGPVLIALDISSMDRTRLALILTAFAEHADRSRVETRVDILYALPRDPPPPMSELAIEHFGPACESLAGWSDGPERPTAIVVGLGHEDDIALGACANLDAALVVAMRPRGRPEFELGMERANATLLQVLEPGAVISYDVDRPFETYCRLESVAAGLKDTKTILLPLGPKIFAACAILLSIASGGRIGVWRVSSGSNATPRDVVASGQLVMLSVTFGSHFTSGLR